MMAARITIVLAGLLAGLLGCAHPAQPALANPSCDAVSIVRQALDDLGEHAARFRLISPEQMAVEVGDSSIYAFAEPERLTINTAAQCRYIAATVAHETAHIWQYRATSARGGELYSVLVHGHAEIIADCVALSTGWEDYRPYLTEREKRNGPKGCTAAEMAAAHALRSWAR